MKRILPIICALTLLCSCGLMSSYGTQIDETKLDFESQLSLPEVGEEIAVVTTDAGVIHMKLFSEHAPKACENFITLAKEGYYNDTFVFCVEPSVAFMAGTSDREGLNATTVFEANEPFDNEYTDALWHFPGAVSSMSGAQDKSDSRFFITADAPVSNETLESMARVGYPQALIDRYREEGGVPGLDRNYTVFAQVYEGFEVIEAIMGAATDENGIPTPDIKIQKIEITTYDGE